jgi:hypothetical protein
MTYEWTFLLLQVWLRWAWFWVIFTDYGGRLRVLFSKFVSILLHKVYNPVVDESKSGWVALFSYWMRDVSVLGVS